MPHLGGAIHVRVASAAGLLLRAAATVAVLRNRAHRGSGHGDVSGTALHRDEVHVVVGHGDADEVLLFELRQLGRRRTQPGGAGRGHAKAIAALEEGRVGVAHLKRVLRRARTGV